MKRYLDFVSGSFTNKVDGVRPDRSVCPCVVLCVSVYACVSLCAFLQLHWVSEKINLTALSLPVI